MINGESTDNSILKYDDSTFDFRELKESSEDLKCKNVRVKRSVALRWNKIIPVPMVDPFQKIESDCIREEMTRQTALSHFTT